MEGGSIVLKYCTIQINADSPALIVCSQSLLAIQKIIKAEFHLPICLFVMDWIPLAHLVTNGREIPDSKMVG